MERDRNLLFGIFAVQLRKVTPSLLMEIAGAWAVDPSKELSQRLVEAGAMSREDRELLARFVNDAVQAHGGDATAALQMFGGEEQVYQSFRGSVVMTESGGVARTADQVTRRLEDEPESAPGVQEVPGRYTHVSEYARGGMGRVLLVHDQHLGRDIALKELLPEIAPNGTESAPSPVRLSVPIMARFLQEARITGQLEHPAIVPVYELGYRKDGTLYYTMKLVRGQTLAKVLKQAKGLKGRLELLPHFVDLCHSIAYAHSRGVIHRDIKPLNVMVGEFGETVVIDWGLAKARGQRDVHAEEMDKTFRAMQIGDAVEFAKTAYGQAMGTPAYMAPEQARGSINEIDERSDVYSLGAVLYEILTGSTPYSGNNILEIIRNAAEGNPKPVCDLEPEAPHELVAICERAMQKDPSARYQASTELAEDIQSFLAGALVKAYQYGILDRAVRIVRRHKLALAAAVVALMVVATIGSLSYRRIMAAREEAAQVSREKEVVEKLRALAEDAGKAALDVSNSGNGLSWRTRACVCVERFSVSSTGNESIGSALGRYIRADFETRLFDTGRFVLVDLQERDAILAEQQKAAASDASDSRVVFGKVREPDFLVQGNVNVRQDTVQIQASLVRVPDKTVVAGPYATLGFIEESESLRGAIQLLVLRLIADCRRSVGFVVEVFDDHLMADFNLSEVPPRKGALAAVIALSDEMFLDAQTGEIVAPPDHNVVTESLHVESVDSSTELCVLKPLSASDVDWHTVKKGMFVIIK